ncbi:MAG: alanyl-tRNA synthetase [Patiriisocius sp.]|jgi:alanyl-tRNA synthetase
MMTSFEIRQAFLDFFKSKQHEVVASAPMVIKDDPTLMFTNAGMNQFKDLILGNSPIVNARISNSQKCLRVSGKHNDLEEVGVDTYHHTMFEMLGNWSFGNYFKKEAIEWAWELLVNVYKIDKDKLYVTIFEGDEADKTALDSEAYDLWRKILPEDRIIKANKKDNFWEMGETGPCGPCSEIHVDLRSDDERKKVDGASLVNMDDPLVIEIWNLVFMQYNRMSDGSLVELTKTHIDTGMGFERLCTVLQHKKSNYDTDVFSPLINKLEKITGIKYQSTDSKSDIAIRVIVDHIRAVSFSIADGQLPSNGGAGYVIRRILRRAIRYAYSFLDQKEPYIHELVDVLATEMGRHFSELSEQKDLIAKIVKEEEVSFLRTLEKGIKRLNDIAKDPASINKEGKVSGEKVFELYDTYGFPVDLTALILGEEGMTLDEKEFEKELEKQKTRSKKDAKMTTGDWIVVAVDEVEEFVGYDQLTADVKITRYRVVEQKGKELFQLVFNYTPFYPEGGGQVGDRGHIDDGKNKYYIQDTKKESNLILHFCDKLPVFPEEDFKAVVDEKKRRSTEKNHSGTHLLHHALRDNFGTHIQQKGSLVNDDYLRFDFSHYEKLKPEDVSKLEADINALVMKNDPLIEKRNTPFNEAIEEGAMALFGEKYSDTVRMIKFGDSIELCGGTHVKHTGEIGTFRVLSESSVASGIRRIEAVTGERALETINGEREILNEIKGLLKNPNDLAKSVQELIEANRNLQNQIANANKASAKDLKGDLKAKIQKINGISFLGEQVDLDQKSLKDMIFELKSEVPDLFIVLANATDDGKVGMTVALSDGLIKDKKMDAGNIIRVISKAIHGGGGGQAFYATAGGRNPDGISEAIEKAKTLIA